MNSKPKKVIQRLCGDWGNFTVTDTGLKKMQPNPLHIFRRRTRCFNQQQVG